MTQNLNHTTVGALDITLALVTLTAAGLAVGLRSRRAQTGAFLSLGVMLSLIWLRLGSLDVAFAEAALGTGLLSAVLVWLAVTSAREPAGTPEHPLPPRLPAWAATLIGLLVGALLTVLLSAVLLRVEQRLPTWSGPLREALPATGVDHDVTGVLLAFRAYDTLLESAVLMAAGVAVLALGRDNDLRSTLDPLPALPSIFRWFTRIVVPVLLLLGLWLLFAGSTGPGGAFQSGAVLASVLIMLNLAGVDMRWMTTKLLLPALIIGVVVFILAGLLGPLTGQSWLSWDPRWAFAAILTVEILLTTGIAAGLYLLYLGLDNPGSSLSRRKVRSP